MTNLGGFSEEALKLFQLAASERGYDDYAEGDTYDFTRCVRPDGSFYGTSGTCKKGSPAGAKEPKTKMGKPDSKLDKEVVGGQKAAAKVERKPKTEAPRPDEDTVKKRLALQEKMEKELTAKKKAGKPRATAGELQRQQKELGEKAQSLRTQARAAEKAHKALEKELKNDRKNPENRKRLMETGRAWDKAITAAERAERAWDKAHERWSKASNREQRAKMSPSQRAEARRIDKIIKERG